MVKVKDVLKCLNDFAPVDLKMDYDNVGFLVGFSENEVSRVIVSLDITSDVIAEAIRENAQLIVSHHPVLFDAVSSVTDNDLVGRKITTMLSGGISAICMHTNLDIVSGGVNDALAREAGITSPQLLCEYGVYDEKPYGIGKYGDLNKTMEFSEYLNFIKTNLNANGLRYYYAGRKVSRVAVVGGSGGSNMYDAIEKGCDTFITSDIRYNVFLEAKELGINLIDGDHFCTENVVVPVLAEKLKCGFPDLEIKISEENTQTARFYM